MTTFYLAARYSRQAELRDYSADLIERGHAVPARWLLGNHEAQPLEVIPDPGESVACIAFEQDILQAIMDSESQAFAKEDMEDLVSADVAVFFTELPNAPLGSRGGRHVEFGVALGRRYTGQSNQKIYIIGPLENVFYHLPEVDGHFQTWQGFLGYLDAANS